MRWRSLWAAVFDITSVKSAIMSALLGSRRVSIPAKTLSNMCLGKYSYFRDFSAVWIVPRNCKIVVLGVSIVVSIVCKNDRFVIIIIIWRKPVFMFVQTPRTQGLSFYTLGFGLKCSSTSLACEVSSTVWRQDSRSDVGYTCCQTFLWLAQIGVTLVV